MLNINKFGWVFLSKKKSTVIFSLNVMFLLFYVFIEVGCSPPTVLNWSNLSQSRNRDEFAIIKNKTNKVWLSLKDTLREKVTCKLVVFFQILSVKNQERPYQFGHGIKATVVHNWLLSSKKQKHCRQKLAINLDQCIFQNTKSVD